MIGGMDRYFQIVKCFRDEDLRADRQPEFTQLDLEISFPTQDTVFGVIENVMVRACAAAGITVKGPFRRMEYKEAIRRYGSDKPDVRFGMELHDVTEHFAAARETLRIEGSVQALRRARRRRLFAQTARRNRGESEIAWRAGRVHGESHG